MEWAVHVDAHHSPPRVEGVLPGPNIRSCDAGVGDQNIDRAMRLLAGLSGSHDRLRVGHVHGAGVNRSTDARRGLLGELAVKVPDLDRCATRGKALDDGLPDALRAARDNGDVSIEINLVHGSLQRVPSETLDHCARRGRGRVQAATPSFFCRLVEDVVYWNSSFFSGYT